MSSPVENRGLPEQDTLRAPGSGGTASSVTFATWLRLMFQVFVLNFPECVTAIQHFPITGDSTINDDTVHTATLGKHPLSTGDMIVQGTHAGKREGSKDGSAPRVVGATHGITGVATLDNWRDWVRCNDDIPFSDKRSIINTDAAARAALGAFVAFSVSDEHGSAKALVKEHGTADGVLLLCLLAKLHESEEDLLGEQRGVDAHSVFTNINLSQFTSMATFLAALDTAADDYNAINTGGKLNDHAKFHQLVAGLRARNEKFAVELLTDQAKNDNSGKPYAWARSRLCRMPVEDFPQTEHANAVVPAPAGAGASGRVSAQNSAAYKMLTQVTASGKVVKANDSRFGVVGNELSNHGGGTEIVLAVGGERQTSAADVQAAALTDRASQTRSGPPSLLAGEGSPYIDGGGRVRASPPPLSPDMPKAVSAAGSSPYIDSAGRVRISSPRRRVVMKPTGQLVVPAALAEPPPLVNDRPALGRTFANVRRATADLVGAVQGPALHLLMLLFLVACGWIAGKAHGLAENDLSACRELHRETPSACGVYAFDAWEGWRSTSPLATSWAPPPDQVFGKYNSWAPPTPPIDRASRRRLAKGMEQSRRRSKVVEATSAARAVASRVGFRRTDPMTCIVMGANVGYESPSSATKATGPGLPSRSQAEEPTPSYPALFAQDFPAARSGVCSVHDGATPSMDELLPSAEAALGGDGVCYSLDGTAQRMCDLALPVGMPAAHPTDASPTVATQCLLCDSGATCHLSNTLAHAFDIKCVPPGTRTLFAAGGERHEIRHTFSIHFEDPDTGLIGTLRNICHAPTMRFEILSVRCLVASRCDVEFHGPEKGGCFIQVPTGHRFKIAMDSALPTCRWRRIPASDFAKLPDSRKQAPAIRPPRSPEPKRVRFDEPPGIALAASPCIEDGVAPFSADDTHSTLLRRCHEAFAHTNCDTIRKCAELQHIKLSPGAMAALSPRACAKFFCSHCAAHKCRPKPDHHGRPARTPEVGHDTVDDGVAKIVSAVCCKGECWFLDASKIPTPEKGVRACAFTHMIWCVDPFDLEIMGFPVATLAHTDRAIMHFIDVVSRRGDPMFSDRRNIRVRLVADSAFKVAKIARVLSDHNIGAPKIAPAGRHACLGFVEGAIDVMQTAAAASMSSSRMPHFLYHHAFEFAAQNRNRFGGSKSRNWCPAHLSHSMPADGSQALPFGTLVRVYIRPGDRRDGMPRGIFCAYLRPAFDGPSGTALVFNFETGCILRTRDLDAYCSPENLPDLGVKECIEIFNRPGFAAREAERQKIRDRSRRPDVVLAAKDECSCASCRSLLDDPIGGSAEFAAAAAPCASAEDRAPPTNIYQIRKRPEWIPPLLAEYKKISTDHDGNGPCIEHVSQSEVRSLMAADPTIELLGVATPCRQKVLDSEGAQEMRCRICLRGDQTSELFAATALGTHAPVAYSVSHNTLMCQALARGWRTSQFDIGTAFPTAPLPPGVQIFAIPPRECSIRMPDGARSYWRVRRNLYGGVASPKIFFRDLVERTFKSFPGTFVQCETDPCCFRFSCMAAPPGSPPGTASTVLHECSLSLHVDDGLLISSSEAAEKWFYRCMQDGLDGRQPYKITAGPLERYLGCNMRDFVDPASGRRVITKSCHQAISQLAHDFDETGCDPCHNPMPCHKKSVLASYVATTASQSEEMEGSRYAELTGSLNYIAAAGRPDLTIAAKILSRFNANPSPFAMTQARRALQYAYTTRHRALTWWAPASGTTDLELEAFCDADHAGLTDLGDDSTVTNDRSVAANYLAFKGMGAAVEWRARALKWPTINSTESEAAAIADTHTSVMFMRDHLSQLGILQTAPTTIHSDSDPAVRNMYRFTSATASRHLNNLLHRARHMVQEKMVQYSWIKGAHNACDFLTKRLSHRAFNAHAITVLGLTPPLRDG